MTGPEAQATGRPMVSVVIPTYNRAPFVCDAIESALAQTYRPIEIIVVDDGSTDDTAAAVAPYLDRIQYLHRENGGPAAARNAGIRQARGAFMAFLDSDDLWEPVKLDAQMRWFDDHPDLAVVSCLARGVDLEGRELNAAGPAQDTLPAGDRTVLRRLLLQNFVSGGSSAVVRRTCFDDVGLFDETLRGTEDWEMWLRVSSRHRIGFVNEAYAIMRSGTANLSAPANVAKMLQHELLALRKHFGGVFWRIGPYDRGMAVSERYGRAAWAHHLGGRNGQAWRCLGRAFACNPVHFVRERAFIGLFVRLTLGEQFLGRLRRLRGSVPARQRVSWR